MVCNLSGHATATIYCMYVSSFLSFNLEYKYTIANLPFFSFGGTMNLVLYSLFLNKIKQQQQQQQQQQQ